MTTNPRSLAEYAAAAAAVGVTILLKVGLDALVDAPTPHLLLFAPVAYGVWRGGIGPGLVAAAAASAAVFLLPSPTVAGPLQHGLFAAECLLLVAMIAWFRNRSLRGREDQLRFTEDRFQLLVNAVKDYAIYLLDPRGNVVTWNPGAERFKGYTAEEIVGRHYSIFFPPEDVAARRPEAELKAATEQGRYEDEGWRLRKDGSRFWANVVVTPLRDQNGKLRGFAKVTRDLTERRAAEERVSRLNAELEQRVIERTAELAAERERWLVTLSSIGDAVIATDEHGRVAFANPVAQALIGWTSAEAAGKPLPDVFHIVNEQTRRAVENPVDKVLREGVVVGLANHTVLIARDGTERPIDDSAAPIRDAQGRIGGVVLVFRDVTEHRRAEAALRRSEARLNGIIESAMDAVVTIDEQQRIRVFNSAAEAMFGVKAADVVGGLLDPLLPEQFREPHRGFVAEFGKTGVTNRSMGRLGEVVGRRADGTEFPVEATISQTEIAGEHMFTAVVRDITERKRAEAAVAGERERLHVTLTSIGDAVVVTDGQGRVTMLNPVAEYLTGWRESEAVGKPLTAVFRIIDEDTRKPADSPAEKVFREGAVVGLANHTVLIARDGAERAIDDSAAPIKDRDGLIIGAVLVFRDVTGRRRGERQEVFLAEMSLELASSLDPDTVLERMTRRTVPRFADLAIIHLQENGALRPAALSHAEPAKEETIRELHRRYPDALQASPVGKVFAAGKPMFAGPLSDAELAAMAVDDQHLAMIRSLGVTGYISVPLSGRSGVFGTLTLAYSGPVRWFSRGDVAFAEELGRRVALALENARLFREARQANRAKDEFLAVVSHELRTPLNAILGWSQILRRGTLPAAEVTHGLEVIERNVKAQTQIIADLLDIGRIISGKLHLEMRPTQPAEVVEAAVESLRLPAEAKSIRLETELDRKAGPVSGDPDRLRQAVANLISNAVKFTPEGGRVRVTLEKAGRFVRIRVTDNGVGIKPDFLPKIFERFRQAEEGSTTRRHGGLGLGLAIVRHLVELHGGRVSAESAGEGKGATFTIELPVAEVEQARERGDGRRPASAPVRLDELKVLAVDDAVDALELVATVLRQRGAEVRTASSAREAVAVLERWVPDVLVSDIGMPDEDGYELIRKIRSLPAERGGKVPAAALTAFAGAEDRERATSAGFQLHIAKPVEPDDLAQSVARLAGRLG